jgi:hypothetical protein
MKKYKKYFYCFDQKFLPLGDSPLFNLQQINLCTISHIIAGVCR